MILCQAIHDPLRFISFLPGNLRTTVVYVRGWISGGRHASTPLTDVLDFFRAETYFACFSMLLFYFRLSFHIGSDQLQGVHFSTLHCPTGYKWDLSEMTFPPLVETSFPAGLAHWGYWYLSPATLTTAPSYLLVTQRPLVQHSNSVSLQHKMGPRSINAHKHPLNIEKSI